MTRNGWTVAMLASAALGFAPVGGAEQAPAVAYAPVQTSAQAAWSSADARVEAVRDATLSAQVAGSIVALTVHAGDRVKAGQELLRMDARMASQGAAASNAQVAAAQAQAQLAQREYERQKQLFARRYVSQAALDNAQAQWQASQAQVKALQAQAGVAATQSGLHVLRAPFDGVVASVPVALGDMALPGKPLVSLYDPAQLRISAALAQQQAAQLGAGGGVQVELPAAGGERLTIAAAQVQVLPTADVHSHTVTVRAALPHGTPGALPGAFARMWWAGEAGAGQVARLLVPASAVVRRAEMTGVYVQGSDGKPQLRQVRLGQPQGAMVEVLSGLRAGDRVAEQPQMAAKVR